MELYRTFWFSLSTCLLLLLTACAKLSPAEASATVAPRYVWVCSYPDLELRSAGGPLLGPALSNGELIYEILTNAGIQDWDEEGSVGMSLSVKETDYARAIVALVQDDRLKNREIMLSLHMNDSIDHVRMNQGHLELMDISNEPSQMHGWGESVP